MRESVIELLGHHVHCAQEFVQSFAARTGALFGGQIDILVVALARIVIADRLVDFGGALCFVLIGYFITYAASACGISTPG
jgi:hypothetical protein